AFPNGGRLRVWGGSLIDSPWRNQEAAIRVAQAVVVFGTGPLEAGSLVATWNRPDLRCYSLSTRTTSRWVISPKCIPPGSTVRAGGPAAKPGTGCVVLPPRSDNGLAASRDAQGFREWRVYVEGGTAQ